jgi:hypothetical protein
MVYLQITYELLLKRIKHKRHDLDDDVYKRIPGRELFQVHFCWTMFVHIADTKVSNLIYVLKNERFTT